MKVYIISGEPVPRLRFNTSQQVWDNYKQRVYSIQKELESQQGDLPRLFGPITMHVDFFLPGTKKDFSPEKHHIQRPLLGDMIRFVEEMIKPHIVAESCIIVSITSKKYFSKEPRTELYFSDIQ